jgi:hypothetical protein
MSSELSGGNAPSYRSFSSAVANRATWPAEDSGILHSDNRPLVLGIGRWLSAVSRQLSTPRLLDLCRMSHILTSAMAMQLPRDLDARVQAAPGQLFAQASIEYHKAADLLAPAPVPAVADAPAYRHEHARGRRR